MKTLALTNKGIEDISLLEIKELIKADGKAIKGGIVFDCDDFEKIFSLCYNAQSLKKVILLLENMKFDSVDKISLGDGIKDWVNEKTSFRVVCEHEPDTGIRSTEVEYTIGDIIKEKTGAVVNLKTPDIIVYAYIIDNEVFIGIDFCGEDLSKRDYRIFVNKNAIKATIAYSVLRIADVKPKDIVVDPFCKSGEIIIEAGLWLNHFSPNFFTKDKFSFRNFSRFSDFDFDTFFDKEDKKIDDKNIDVTGYDSLLKNVKASQKNSKIAGINKMLNFSRVEISWLELKFKDNKADKIITHLPEMGKMNEREIEKLYREFFYQAEYALKKGGKVLTVSNRKAEVEKSAKEYKFKKISDRSVWQGQKEMFVIVFEK